MKLLLDENLPIKLKYRFTEKGLMAFTVKDMNWLGRQNGELLQLMIKEGFDVFITVDNNLSFQQNFKDYPIQVIVLISPDNTYQTLLTFLDKIIISLNRRWIGGEVILFE